MRTQAGAPPAEAPPIVHEVLAAPGAALDASTRDDMQQRLGVDLGSVRVYTGARAAESARAVSALAYTVGNAIVFDRGRFAPHEPAGRDLLAHELVHTIQQRGAGPLSAGHLLPIDPPDSAAETEARKIASARQRPPLRSGERSGGRLQRQPTVLPVARFSPAPGLWVDRTEKSVSITGAMELWGAAATADRAATVQHVINSAWTCWFPDGHSVDCSITVTYRGPGTSPGSATQIEAAVFTGPSHVSTDGERSMRLNAGTKDVFLWTPAHEFGHIIGLEDRYSESIMSAVRGQLGLSRTTTPRPGYEGNLMAATGGFLESKNVQDIARENDPSAYWFNDDDQVRDWVNEHSLSDIGGLSATSKLAAIKTLLGGWISDDDVAAITRVCRAVTAGADATVIRSGVKLSDITSLDQRRVVRFAFDAMP